MFSTAFRQRISIRALRQIFALIVIAALVFSITPLQGFIQLTPTVEAVSADLFFSEYIEGSSNNKALEIYNATGAPINLAADGYNIQMFFNANATAGLNLNLTGTVNNGDVYVVAQATADPAILAQADQTTTASWYNGNDTVVLRKGTTILDSIGQIASNPTTEWGTGLTSTADNTLRRKITVCGGDTNPNDVFDPSIQWDGFANNTFGGLGSHTSNCLSEVAPAVSSTSPSNGQTDVAITADIVVNFNEPVNVSGSWFTISCGSSGGHTATFSPAANSTSYTIDPDTNFAFNETCTVTIVGNQVSDNDVNDPPDIMAANYVFSFTTGGDPCLSAYTNIYNVQGSGTSSPFPNGTPITIRGIVTGDFQGAAAFNGFHVQDATGDGNALTSDGIFVFAPGAMDVAIGDELVVKGEVTEFNGMTEINDVTSVTKCGVGIISPTTVDLPETVEGDLERYEGMLVTIPETLSVTENFNLGRFGEAMLSSDGRLFQPTQTIDPSSVPGSPYQLAFDENNRRKILLDDGKSGQNPNPIPYLGPGGTLRTGDTVAGLTGVVEFRFSEYRVQPTLAPVFSYVNTRPASPSSVGGNVKVASANVLNYFNGNGTGLAGAAGGFPTARGADSLDEFNRQRPKVIASLTTLDADVLGVIEVESDGGGPTSAIQDLVNGMNAATAPGTYAFIVGPSPGTDLIQNAIIYKPGSVTPIGATVNDVDLAWAQARAPLAQLFEYNANQERFTFIVNHFTSKDCSASDVGSDGDAGDGQGCDNFQRTLQANRLVFFISDRQTASGDSDVLAMGDLNAYAAEDPIDILNTAGLVNEIDRFIGDSAYSFVFRGESGYLDYAFSTASLSDQVTGATEWHINADEPSVMDYNLEFKTHDPYAPTPYRSADHDPVIVGLNLNAPPVIQTLTASPNPALVNGEVDFSATFTDADSADTHTASWDWGDGSSSPGTVSGGSVNDSHTYTAVGTYTVTLTVTDNDGNSDTETIEVKVTYGINVLFDQTKAHKAGSTIPIKLQIVDVNGNNLSSGDITVHLVAIKKDSNVVSGTDYDSGDANPDNDFRFDAGLGGYVFNLSTKNLGLTSGEYTLCFSVKDDPVIHSVSFKVK